MGLRVVSAIMFSPRGGSAHVARALARGLRSLGCSVTLVAGSRSDLGPHGDARVFYREVHAVDFGPALASGAPMRFQGTEGSAPMHPSFEDRPSAPDRVFAALDDLDYERQVGAWSRELDGAGAASADVLHLHHLTPLNEAAARIAPQIPVVGQLHGTELLMLEKIDGGAPPGWRHAERWAERMRSWAGRCARLLASPAGVERAVALLGVPSEKVISLPNGVDTEAFRPRPLDRSTFWHRVLVEQPNGWLPGHPPGSARYKADEVARLAAGTIFLYVGRFTEVKRLDLLIGAFARVRERFYDDVGLVLVGGHPGEWEGEHPVEIAARVKASGVFLAGWYGHEELPDFLRAADSAVLTSDREQFGQVLVEAMACGLPSIATRSLGPESVVEDGATGWLTPRDDEAALARALAEAVEDPQERVRRGRASRVAACKRFSWSRVSGRLKSVLEEVATEARRATAGEG